MRILVAALALLAVGCSNAPAPSGLVTSANVTVSNGREYVIETYFAAADDAALRQTRPNGEVNVSVIQGDSAWTDPHQDVPPEMLRTVVLGHQFHALARDFDTIAINARDEGGARIGEWPYGGTFRATRAGGRVESLVFTFTRAPEIRVTFSEWRDVDGVETPYHLRIEDGSNTFEYAFTRIEGVDAAPDWARR